MDSVWKGARISDATHVVLVSGVKANDAVVTGPFRILTKLHDGDPVEVVKEEKKTSTENEKK